MVAAAVSWVAVLVVAGGSQAASPPNPADPCSRAGRNGCETAGVGFYASYRYGLRWFGDYRGAVAGTRNESPAVSTSRDGVCVVAAWSASTVYPWLRNRRR